MPLRSVPAILVRCVLLVTPIASSAEDRGPSTPEERKRALDIIQRFEADPLNPSFKEDIQWLTIWAIQIPDVHVHLCTIVSLPNGDRKRSQVLFTAMAAAQMGFAVEHRDQEPNLLREYQAGVDAGLGAYERVITANQKDRQPFIDELVQRREA